MRTSSAQFESYESKGIRHVENVVEFTFRPEPPEIKKSSLADDFLFMPVVLEKNNKRLTILFFVLYYNRKPTKEDLSCLKK